MNQSALNRLSWFGEAMKPKPGEVVLEADFEAVFEALFEQQWAPLCRTLYRLLGDWDEAEDLALESFFQFYRQPPAHQQNLTGWLYRVGTRLGFNALRSRKRRQKYELQAGMETLQTNVSADPMHDVERQMEQERVREVLQSLKPRSARILLLRYSGLSYAEIASALDIAPGSIGALLARAEKEFENAFRFQS